MGLVTRTIWLFMIILGATLSVTAYLNFHKFERTLFGLAQSRFSFVLFDIKNTVEYNLGLGLTLPVIRQSQQVIERETVRDNNILSIVIFDQNGVSLFSSERGGIGDRVPEDWVNRGMTASRTADGEALWSTEERDAFLVGTPLVNSFDKVVGGVVLRYSRTYLDEQVSFMLLEVAKMGGLIFLAAALVGSLLMVLAFRRPLHELAAEDRALRDLDLNTLPAGGPPAVFASSALGLLAEMDEAERKIEALDQLV